MAFEAEAEKTKRIFYFAFFSSQEPDANSLVVGTGGE